MRKQGIELRFSTKGATVADLECAEAAAWTVFEEAGVNPWAARAADFKLEGIVEFGLGAGIEEMTDDEYELARLWKAAIHEAEVTFFGTEDCDLDPRSYLDFELVPSFPPAPDEFRRNLKADG